MPSAVNMQLTYLLNPHSFPRCWLLLLKLSIDEHIGLVVVVYGGLCLVTQQLTEGLFALHPSGNVLFVLLEMAAMESCSEILQKQ